MLACFHDQRLGLVRRLAGDFGEFIDGQIGQIVAGLYPVFMQLGNQLGSEAFQVAQILLGDYGMVDAGFGYRYKRWTANITVRNVLDEYAFRTASGADRIYPEKPRHAILTIATQF